MISYCPDMKFKVVISENGSWKSGQEKIKINLRSPYFILRIWDYFSLQSRELIKDIEPVRHGKFPIFHQLLATGDHLRLL